MLSAAELAKGQVDPAVAHYKLTLLKQYQGYQRDQFPAGQKPPVEIRKAYLQDSPGIQTSAPAVQVAGQGVDRRRRPPLGHGPGSLSGWIAKNIRPQIGSYTSVTAALENRKGDCEEMAAVFVALCRTHGHSGATGLGAQPQLGRVLSRPTKRGPAIGFRPTRPAIPGSAGPAPTSWCCKKGIGLTFPSSTSGCGCWKTGRSGGAKPRSRFTAEIKPLPPAEGQDAGPGHRIKDARGEWKVVGDHPVDHYMRR